MINSIYIAAPFSDKADMPAVAGWLEDEGFEITHKWWETEATEETAPHEARVVSAMEDWAGVRKADAVLLINSKKSEGKAVEQGLAIAYGLPIVAVGKRGETSKNVFHHLPNYVWVETMEEAVDALCQRI